MENPPRDYVFWTNCVNSVGELINEMVDDDVSKDVTYETMLAHADGMLEKADELGYDRRSNQGAGVTLKNDWAVSFHKSFYCGVPCYYFVYSGIEYIWIQKGREREVQACEEEARAIAPPPTSLLARDLIPGGRAAGRSPADFDQEQLQRGIRVELEHVDPSDPNGWDIAREIAMDHLAEDPDYYHKLAIIDPHDEPRDNPADLFELRLSVRNVSLHDHRTGEELSPVYGWSVSDIVDLLEPTLVLSQDPREFRASFGFNPSYIEKPTLAYAYQVRIMGDVGVQKVNQIGLVAETSKMVCGSFSLPAGNPRRGGCCLISSMRKPQICADCYAKTGHYLYPSKLIGAEAVRRWVVDILEQGGPELLGELLATAISDYYVRTHTERTSGLSMNPYYFRIHDAGDFGWYGPDYYRAWVIATAMQPGIRFWAPTRDHLNSRMLRAYQTIERPENFVLRPSALRFQEPPPRIDGLDAGTSSAYTADGLPAPLDLVDHDCPAYAGTGHCESEKCRVCWEEPDVTVNYTPHNTTSKTNIPLLRSQL
jgi:hypothetical protein